MINAGVADNRSSATSFRAHSANCQLQTTPFDSTSLFLFFTMVVKGIRAAKGVVSLWSTDQSTFPVVFLVGFAMLGALGNGARFVTNSPDVCLTKAKRNNLMHYDEDQGAEWSARRKGFATMRKNVADQSRAFNNEESDEAKK